MANNCNSLIPARSETHEDQELTSSFAAFKPFQSTAVHQESHFTTEAAGNVNHFMHERLFWDQTNFIWERISGTYQIPGCSRVQDNESFETTQEHQTVATQEHKTEAKQADSKSEVINKSNNNNSFNRYVNFTLFPVLCICAGVLWYAMNTASQRRVCEVVLDANSLELKLTQNVYGQDLPIRNIVSALRRFSYPKDPRMEVLVFTGGSGVGKSFTASLLRASFQWADNVQHLVVPVCPVAHLLTAVSSQLSSCGDNLVIIDELTLNEANASRHLLENLSTFIQNQNLRAVIILIFNLQESISTDLSYTDVDLEAKMAVKRFRLQEVYQQLPLNVTFVTFNFLNIDDIVNCTKDYIKHKNITVSEVELNNAITYLLKLHSGCKGIESRLRYLLDGNND